jgi:hypothetical protein
MSNTTQIKLYPKQEPTLLSGTYTLTVKQTVEVNEKSINETYINETKYEVENSGYDIENQIVQLFPPNNADGDYTNLLAQVVLENKSLPWERDKDKPWLALILLHEDEDFSFKTYLKSEIETMALFCPSYSKEKFDKETQNEFTLLELPCALLKSILPLEEELKYLAHVREVVPCATQSEAYLNRLTSIALQDEAPRFSVVLCNRLPKKGRNTLALVSVENLYKELNSEENVTKRINVIVLKKWCFTNTDSKENFSAFLEKEVSASAYALKIPEQTPNVQQDTVNCINNGFVPLKQITSDGNEQPMFYRGPLMPHNAHLESTFIELKNMPHNHPLKESYKAAYQLGRLLCLQNKGIAESVINRRTTNTRQFYLGQHQLEKLKVSQPRHDKLPNDNLAIKISALDELNNLLNKFNTLTQK